MQTTKSKSNVFLALAAINTIAVFAQTKIDLRTQGKSVDFNSATSTKPSKIGTACPGTCSTGETLFKTDARPARARTRTVARRQISGRYRADSGGLSWWSFTVDLKTRERFEQVVSTIEWLAVRLLLLVLVLTGCWKILLGHLRN
jgi:hypothetical protein